MGNKMSEEIEEVISKPESMLTPKVKQVLLETIKSETEKAMKENDTAYLVDLQNAKKLIQRGAWKIRKANAYLVHMERCLLGHGGTLKDTQEAMKKCAEEWRKLSENEKKRLEIEAGELGIYDYV
jgi:hypothetical protein